MSTIKQFEDLEIWKRAREICQDIYLIRDKTNLKNDFKLYNQLNGSSGSIMDNIAEGFERNGNKSFASFYLLLRPPVEKQGLSSIESWIGTTLVKKNLTLLSKN